ncbi:kinase-like domain-containing protein, partial [Blyttiomyces helicus]
MNRRERGALPRELVGRERPREDADRDRQKLPTPPQGEERRAAAGPASRDCPPPPLVILDEKAGAKYSRGDLLGEGGFARCYEVTNAVGVRSAVKLIAEIRIHQMMEHDHIVRFDHVFEDTENVYMILEICENRTLVDMLKKRKRLTEPEVRYIMWQLLDAVRYMHRLGIIHRDVKLGNLFLTKDMRLKLGDFGLATMLKHDGERKKTICGTPNYIAPEVLFDRANGHSFEVDIWSLGVVMYTLLIGRPPFQTKDVNAIYKKIRDNSYEFPPQIPTSENARS